MVRWKSAFSRRIKLIQQTISENAAQAVANRIQELGRVVQTEIATYAENRNTTVNKNGNPQPWNWDDEPNEINRPCRNDSPMRIAALRNAQPPRATTAARKRARRLLPAWTALRSNGDVDGLRGDGRLEPRTHTLFPGPRRHYRASRAPPTIVRLPLQHRRPPLPSQHLVEKAVRRPYPCRGKTLLPIHLHAQVPKLKPPSSHCGSLRPRSVLARTSSGRI